MLEAAVAGKKGIGQGHLYAGIKGREVDERGDVRYWSLGTAPARDATGTLS